LGPYSTAVVLRRAPSAASMQSLQLQRCTVPCSVAKSHNLSHGPHRAFRQQRSLPNEAASRGQRRMRLSSPSSHHCVAARRRSCIAAAMSTIPDEVFKMISNNDEVTVTVISARELVQDACSRHGTAPTASAALGRGLVGALLLSAFREENEKTQVTFRGDGELGELQAIATSGGQVKGKVINPAADPPLRPDGKLNVGAAVGAGIVAVVRSHPASASPYTGMTPIVSGEIAEDLARYLADSEQTQCALGLGVSIDRSTAVASAGGFLVQVLPFASEETLTALEKNLTGMKPVSQLLQDGLTPRQIASSLLGELEAPEDNGFSLTPTYGPCEVGDLEVRMKRSLAALGRKEIESIVEEEGRIEVTCEFCKTTLVLDHDQMLKEMSAE